MPDLLGIIVPLRKFLSNSKENITLINPDESILILEKKRSYIIPDFQREIRWNEDNVGLLLDDLLAGPKYLGNIILTQHKSNSFSIIDGQQRITILTMILTAITKYHGSDMEVLSPCKLEIESFPNFEMLLERYFPEDQINSKEVCESDHLHQKEKYLSLWQYLCNHEMIKSRKKAGALLKNLGQSSVNLILNKSDDIKDGIRYFIDVNLKGKQLDVEDIFKSYLFIQDSGKEIRGAWYRFKTNAVLAERSKISYPLLKLLEHFFYCELYKDPKYKGMEFDDKFLLKREFVTKEEEPIPYRKGCHLVELIDSKKYMLEALNKLNETIEIMIQIVQSSAPSHGFDQLFSVHNDRLQEIELKSMHNIMKKTLLDSSILPKALIMKYILTTLRGRHVNSKNEYRKIYGVYLLSVLFTVFENKKSKDILLNVLKSDDDNWYQEAVKQINSYFSPDKITDARLQAQFKFSINEQEEDYRFRCKSLATIYNFFQVDKQHVFVPTDKISELCRFVTDDETFSLEHFIISDSKSRESVVTIEQNQVTYQYDDSFYKKYVNSMFNYIFIPQSVNSALENRWLPDKLLLLSRNYRTEIECAYSQMIIKKVKALSNAMYKAGSENPRITDGLDLFFARDYRDLYVAFAREVLTDFICHIKSTK